MWMSLDFKKRNSMRICSVLGGGIKYYFKIERSFGLEMQIRT
jgi:hypothetical protein